MPPKRKPLGELSNNANTLTPTTPRKRPKSSRAAASKATAAVSALISATCDWNSELENLNSWSTILTPNSTQDSEPQSTRKTTPQPGHTSTVTAPEAITGSKISKKRKNTSITESKKNLNLDEPELVFQPMEQNEHKMLALLPFRFTAEEATASDWFSLFWTDNDWENLKQNTNKYATKQRTPDPTTAVTPRPLYGRWKPVNIAELKAYVAIVIVLGVFRVRSYREFWRQKWECKLGIQLQRRVPRRGTRAKTVHHDMVWIPYHDIFSTALSCSRFIQIKRYIHVCDPNIHLNEAEWYKKLEPLNSSIRGRCQSLAVPATNTSVDEMMVRFFGCSKHTVRMPKKPIK
ncbi:hypothetical protein K440DRAFT_638920 [Wilcoxina mikolae CBS 423.85]|nr:hypothetical protein K440DRAFT_638920 [Wilcoxina mikolae CBS 423.85]